MVQPHPKHFIVQIEVKGHVKLEMSAGIRKGKPCQATGFKRHTSANGVIFHCAILAAS
jgi:hypothetical protein